MNKLLVFKSICKFGLFNCFDILGTNKCGFMALSNKNQIRITFREIHYDRILLKEKVAMLQFV